MASGKHPESGDNTRPQNSLIDRIGVSATTLARSALAGPSEDNDSLASFSDQGGKAEASSAASQGAASENRFWTAAHMPASRPEGLRTQISHVSQDAQTAQTAFDDFLNPDSNKLVSYDGPLTVREATQPNNLQSAWIRDLGHGNTFNSKSADTPRNLAGDQGSHPNYDGAAVVSLLADPSFTTYDNPTSLWDQAEDDPASIFDARTDSEVQSSIEQPRSGVFHLTEDLLGSDKDLGLWQDLLNRYHDEVWGDQLPLVKEAQKELQQAVAVGDSNATGLPALRRLRMLLGHVRATG